jgi:hypothetical protein
VSGPRNRVAFERGQRHRALIRDILIAHAQAHPLGPSITGTQVRIKLLCQGITLGLSTVHYHMSAIRLGWNPSYSLPDEKAA